MPFAVMIVGGHGGVQGGSEGSGGIDDGKYGDGDDASEANDAGADGDR